MEQRTTKPDELIMSASGKQVRKGEVSGVQERAPEIKFEEIKWGEKIGGGCFGSVFKGKCRGQDVAIKQLLKQDLDSKILEDFRREVDIMTQMRHPNVVLFMGACTEPGKMVIVTELLSFSVHDLLRKNKDITLLQRIKLAKGTAAGIAWLHGATPQIIHRDLKPNNLLVDEHWNVKVCDFGLSQVKLRENKIRDGKSIPGTPLWMSPEVLLGQDVDEKADVYSFGIVLWEIITGQEPFPYMEDFKQFKNAITKLKERPVIPENTHPNLKSLMELCWDQDPNKRPTFQQILPLLDSVIVDCLIADPEGNRFWKSWYLGKEHVNWGEFTRKFANLLGISEPNPKDINFMCLKKILASPNMEGVQTDPDVVKIEKFGQLLDWFGPIIPDSGKSKGIIASAFSPAKFTILDKIRSCMQKEWFHGDITREAAEDFLAGQPKGTFLVRTSTTDRHSPFTISKLTKKGKINHQRIQRLQDGKFKVEIKYANGKVETESSKDDLLVPFIRALSTELALSSPCPGSKFRSLFLDTKIEGYLVSDD